MANYPLIFSFKLIAFNPQIRVTDASGALVLYVKQKALALKEDVKVYAEEAQQNLKYQMKADKIIDFSAKYIIRDAGGTVLGAIKRKGLLSIWRATYLVFDAGDNEIGTIFEENPWVKVLDSLVSNIPFLNMFVNPAYIAEIRGVKCFRLKKQPAFFEGKFQLQKIADGSAADENIILPGMVMLMIMNRQRG
jgi:hypothetical protein